MVYCFPKDKTDTTSLLFNVMHVEFRGECFGASVEKLMMMLIRTEGMLIPVECRVTILIIAITLITHCVLLGDHSARQAVYTLLTLFEPLSARHDGSLSSLVPQQALALISYQ